MDYQGDGNSGGGYTNIFGGGGTPDASQGKPRRSYDEQTLIPVTIKMALGAQQDPAGGDGSLSLEDGRKVSSIKIIGAVKSFNPQTTNVVFEIEDGTGLVEVKQWLDDNDCQALQEIRDSCMKDHIYVKVIGQIKDYEGKKILVANAVRPLADANELTHHMLQVVYSAEKAKRQNSIVAPPMMNSGVGFGSPLGGSSMPVAQTTGGAGDSLKEQVMAYIRDQDGKKSAVLELGIVLLFVTWISSH